MRTLRLLSGGAAQGVVGRLQPGFESRHGCRLVGTFGAVGAMKDKLLAGEACDLVILSEALVRELGGQGHVDGSTGRSVGGVRTGVAVKEGSTRQVRSVDDLTALLRAAPAIYFPDPQKATAGIHFMKVLQALGLAGDASRLRTFPNGATAMAALAQDPSPESAGCTQVTEILITAGVRLAGVLPPPHGLTTTYTAAVTRSAQEPQLARALIEALCAPESAAIRRECGFE